MAEVAELIMTDPRPVRYFGPYRLSAILVATGLLLWGCKPKPQESESPPFKVTGDTVRFESNAPQLSSLTVEPIADQEPNFFSLPGRLAWNEDSTVRVFAPFTGIVRKLWVEVGEPVSKGAPLASIESAEYAQAQAEARKSESEFLRAQRNLTRLQELSSSGAAARKDLEAAENDFASAQAEKDRTQQRLAIYGAVSSATNRDFLLPSPLDGALVERNITLGQEVRPDQMLANTAQITAPLFVVSDPTRLWVQIDATETDLPHLKLGREFTVTTRAFPDQVFKGRVAVVSEFIDPATRTVKVRGEVENPKRLLKAEMFVKLMFPDRASLGASVPLKAVFLKGDKHYAFVEETPGQFTRRELQVGPEKEGRIFVRAGVKAGERVVTDGCILLEQLLK